MEKKLMDQKLQNEKLIGELNLANVKKNNID